MRRIIVLLAVESAFCLECSRIKNTNKPLSVTQVSTAVITINSCYVTVFIIFYPPSHTEAECVSVRAARPRSSI